MATNEELENQFGTKLCFFFSHEFVRKHLRRVEVQVQPTEEQQENPTDESSSNAKRISNATSSDGSVHDESFKSALSDSDATVISNTQAPSNGDMDDGTLTTLIECVELPKPILSSDEQSDENSVNDKSNSDLEIEIDTPSEQTGKSLNEPSTNELLDANTVTDSIETGKSRYNIRTRKKKPDYLNNSRLKEVQELGLNHSTKRTPDQPKYGQKKIKLLQPNKGLQKYLTSFPIEDDTDIEMSEDKDEDLFSDSSKKRMPTGKTKKVYDMDEDHEILKFIFKYNRFTETKGNRLWQDMETEKVNFPRPWQSLKERFRKHIAPQLSLYTHLFNLDQDSVDTLQKSIGKG